MTKQEADTLCSELFQLMKPHVATNIMQRVNLYVVERAQKKLPDFIATAEPELKGTIIKELIEIVKGNQWDKLPAAANGQASAKVATPAPKPAVVEAPKPVVVAPVVEAPKPKLIEVPAPVVVIEPVKEVVVLEDEEEQAAEDPLAIITAQLTKLTKTKPSLSEVEVRKIVRSELAIVFRSLAEVLKTK